MCLFFIGPVLHRPQRSPTTTRKLASVLIPFTFADILTSIPASRKDFHRLLILCFSVLKTTIDALWVKFIFHLYPKSAFLTTYTSEQWTAQLPDFRSQANDKQLTILEGCLTPQKRNSRHILESKTTGPKLHILF